MTKILSCFISQEPNIPLSFMVHMCKMIISPDFFFSNRTWTHNHLVHKRTLNHLAKLARFFGLLGGKKAKNGPKWQKILSVTLCISGTIHHMIVIYGTHVYSDNISRLFFQFFKILIFWVVRGVKVQKMVHNDKKFCSWHFISQGSYILWLIYGTHL